MTEDLVDKCPPGRREKVILRPSPAVRLEEILDPNGARTGVGAPYYGLGGESCFSQRDDEKQPDPCSCQAESPRVFRDSLESPGEAGQSDAVDPDGIPGPPVHGRGEEDP